MNKIKHEYATYKANHFGKKGSAFSNFRTTTEGYINTEESTNRETNPNEVIFYQSSQKIYKLIPKHFFATDQFTISREILEKKREDIEKYCRELIEKCGDVEFEIERILEHSGKLYNFINSNLYPLNDDLENALRNVQAMKNYKKVIKLKLIENSAKTIQLGVKRKNLSNMIQIMKNIKSLKKILELLKVLANNPSKYQVCQDLLNKSRMIISTVYKLSDNGIQDKKRSSNGGFNALKILKSLEDEFNKISNKSSDKIQIEFGNMIKEQLNQLISIKHPEKNYSESDLNLDEYVKYYALLTINLLTLIIFSK